MEQLSQLLNHPPHLVIWFILGILVVIGGILLNGWWASITHEMTNENIMVLLFTLLLGLFVAIGGSNAALGHWQTKIETEIDQISMTHSYALIKRQDGTKVLLIAPTTKPISAKGPVKLEHVHGIEFRDLPKSVKNRKVNGTINLQHGEKMQSISAKQAQQMLDDASQ